MYSVFHWFESYIGSIIVGLWAIVWIIGIVIFFWSGIARDWLGREEEDDGKIGK
jgi:hypothetical protein